MSHLLRAYERGVLRVTINRPAKRNAVSREVLQELKAVFRAHAALDDLRLAVLGGAGELAFCAGADLVDLAEVREAEAAEAFAADATTALDAIRLFPVPTVAALNGVALGGGAELALACDMRVAAAHARIGFLHAQLNTSTAWGGGPDLARLVGYAKALELLAEALDTAQELGMKPLTDRCLELKLDLQGVIRDMYRFLEVDPTFEPDLETPHNVGGVPASMRLERLLTSHAIRRAAEPLIPKGVADRVRRLRTRNLRRAPSLPTELKSELMGRFREDIAKTSELTGRSLDHWLEPASPSEP